MSVFLLTVATQRVSNLLSLSARRAKLKQKEAKAVGKSMKHLGRYGR